MADPESELDLRQVLRVVRRRGWIVLVAVFLGLVAGYLYAALQTSRYAATATVQVRDSNASVIDPSRSAAGNASTAEREVATQLEFAKSTEVRSRARELLGDPSASISVSPSAVSGTDLIDFRVESDKPEVAQAGANAFADAYVERRREQLQAGLAENSADLRSQADERTAQIAAIDDQLNAEDNGLSAAEIDGKQAERASLVNQRTELQTQANELEVLAAVRSATIVVTERANLPSEPFEPKPARAALVGGLIGLVLGVGLVFLLERLDDRITSVDEVAALTGGLAVLGSIPVVGRRRRFGHHRLPHGTRALVPPNSLAGEAYRTLQTSLRFSSLGQAKQILLVTSAVSGEGKTTCTANLAAVLAENGQRVVVVSADLRQPTLAGMFGVDEAGKGLTSVVLGDAQLSDALIPTRLESGKTVYVLPAGPLPMNPTELLASERFGQVLKDLSGAGADFVLVDCAPVLPVSDPLAAAQYVHGVLVMTVEGESVRSNLVDAVARLRQVQAPLIGVVVNGLASQAYAYGGYGYGYGQSPASA